LLCRSSPREKPRGGAAVVPEGAAGWLVDAPGRGLLEAFKEKRKPVFRGR
jgi:hypothetical protein